MRDFLSYDPKAEAPAPEFTAPDPGDPVQRARRLSRRDLPKRFYTEASVAAADGGFRVLLDGRPVMTPAKRPLVFPRRGLAEAAAAEWAAQGVEIDPTSMPYTRMANAAIDGVAERLGEVVDDAAKYAATDLVCYRADGPERLVERQAAAWDPVLDHAEERYGARFLVAEGIVHVAQDAEALAAVRRPVAALDAWRLTGFHVITTLTGSLLIALTVLDGRLDPDDAWATAHVDEDWTNELWGRDAEAEARRAHRRRDFDAAVAFARGTDAAAG
jgi:chaperone required for assembly of F1-ATPase